MNYTYISSLPYLFIYLFKTFQHTQLSTKEALQFISDIVCIKQDAKVWNAYRHLSSDSSHKQAC
jgi:hypothetical protein